MTYVILYIVCLALFLSIDRDEYGLHYLRDAGIKQYLHKTNTTFSDEWLEQLKPTSEQLVDYLQLNGIILACLIILHILFVTLTNYILKASIDFRTADQEFRTGQVNHQLAVYNDAPEDEQNRLRTATTTLKQRKEEAYSTVVAKSRCLEGLQALNYLLHMIDLFC